MQNHKMIHRICKKKLTFISIIFLVHLCVVLLLIPWFTDHYPKLYHINNFPDGYDKVATNLIDGRGYRLFEETSETVMRPPAYVFFLAVIFTFFGKKLVVVQIINIMLTCISCYILWIIAQQVIPDFSYPCLPGLLFCFHPGIILLESRAGLESLFILTCLSFLYFFYKSLETDKKIFYSLSGICWGLTALVKSTIIGVVPFLCIYLFFKKIRSLSMTATSLRIALMVFMGVLILSPWILRNYYLTNKIILTNTSLGHTLYPGLYVNENLTTQKEHYQLLNEATDELNDMAEGLNLSFIKGFGQYFYNVDDEVFFNRYVVNLVKEKYLNSPSLLVKNCFFNFVRFWFQGRTNKSSIMNMLITIPFLGIVFGGIYYGYKRRLYIGPILIFMAFYMLAHLPIMGVARYHMPLIPLMAILGSICIGHWTGANNYESERGNSYKHFKTSAK